MLAQLVEDLLHLERGQDRLDQNGAADRAGRQRELVLGERERRSPEPRLEVALELRQVEVRPAAALELLPRVVVDGQAEIEQRRRDGSAVDEQVALVEMPAAGADEQRRGPVVQPVRLVGRLERKRSANGAVDVALPVDDVRPGRRAGVLEVGHEDAGARVERVDHHLPLDRTGDLTAPVAQVGRRRRDPPFAVADRPGLGQKAGARPGRELGLALVPPSEQLEPRRVELAVEAGDELDRLWRENLAVSRREQLESCRAHNPRTELPASARPK